MKTEDQNVSTAMHMDIWQENAENQRRMKIRRNQEEVEESDEEEDDRKKGFVEDSE